jgi:hypothetical protein
MLIHRAVSSLALLCALAQGDGESLTSTERSSAGPPTGTAVFRLRRVTVTGLRLVVADTDKPIPGYDPLPLVARIDLNTLPSPNLSLEALTNGTVKSVSWKAQSFSRIDNSAPWSMCYNSGPDFNPCPNLVAGFNSIITVVPYAVSSAQAGRGMPYSVQLSLYRGPSTKAPVPAVAPTKAPIIVVAPFKSPVAPMKTPAALTKAPTTSKAPTITRTIELLFISLPWRQYQEIKLVNNGTVEYKIGQTYTVFAGTYMVSAGILDPSVQSVQFTYDGKVVRVENTMPFVLAGKQGSILSPWIPTQGQHTLVATSYSQKNASGAVLASSTVSFVARVAKDTGKPLLLKFRVTTNKVNALDPPKALEMSLKARDDESGVARATVFLCSDVSYVANVTKRFDAASSSRAKPLAFNMSLPYPNTLPPGSYFYIIELEDFDGNVGAGVPRDETTDVDTNLNLWVHERRVELLNFTAQLVNPTTIDESLLPVLIQTQITMKEYTMRENKVRKICVSATGDGFSTQYLDDELISLHCKDYPYNLVPGQPFVIYLTVAMYSHLPTGAYWLRVFTSDPEYDSKRERSVDTSEFSFDSAYLASKGFASVVNFVNPYVRSNWKPPQVKSLVALSPTTLDLSARGIGTVSTRLVIQDDVSGFDGNIQFWLNNRIAAVVGAFDNDFSLVVGQPTTIDVNMTIFGRPGTYPLSLAFIDRFSNVANVTSASLARQGFPLVIEVTGVINTPVSDIFSFQFTSSESDVSFGYRRIVIGTSFGSDPWPGRSSGVSRGGSINLTATGASDSNRGVVLQGSDRDCQIVWVRGLGYYYCFILDETTPMGLYLMTADVRNGLLYDSSALLAKGFANNFTGTNYLTTGLGP